MNDDKVFITQFLLNKIAYWLKPPVESLLKFKIIVPGKLLVNFVKKQFHYFFHFYLVCRIFDKANYKIVAGRVLQIQFYFKPVVQ